MAPLPPVKAFEPEGLTNQPGAARPQIPILAAHKAYIFDAIPDIGWGHADLHHWPADLHHWLGHGDVYGRGLVGNRAAAGQRGDDCEQTNHSDIFYFHIREWRKGTLAAMGCNPYMEAESRQVLAWREIHANSKRLLRKKYKARVGAIYRKSTHFK
jgi:hypothetical protein